MGWEGYVLLGVALALAGSAPLVARRVQESRLSRAGLDQIAHMTDADMVLHMARLFGALGYRVLRPPESPADFDLYLTDGLDQRRGVLIRHWRQQVAEGPVRAAAEAADRLGIATPMVVSVEGYTYKAREEGSRAGVILWSLPELTEAIGRVRQQAVAFPDLPRINPVVSGETESARQEAAPAPEAVRKQVEVQKRRRGWDASKPPRCPRCGRPMVVRRSGVEEYWGCPTYPRCLGTRAK